MLEINQNIIHKYPWNPKAVWLYRTKLIAELVPDDLAVVDIGGGMGNIYQYLKNKDGYISIDVEPWTNKTVVADLNAGNYPAIPDCPRFIICQGIIEYMQDPFTFLDEIKKYGGIMAISYYRHRTKVARCHNFNFEFFEGLLKSHGWNIEKSFVGLKTEKSIIEKIYLCTTTPKT